MLDLTRDITTMGLNDLTRDISTFNLNNLTRDITSLGLNNLTRDISTFDLLQNLAKRRVVKQYVTVTAPAQQINVTANPVVNVQAPQPPSDDGSDEPDDLLNLLQNLAVKKVIKQIVTVVQPPPIVNVTANPVVNVTPPPPRSDDGSDDFDATDSGLILLTRDISTFGILI